MIRCPIELLQAEFKHSEHLRDLFVSYSETLLSQVQQMSRAMLRIQQSRESCRWLLMMHDRAEGKAQPYTHEFLSHSRRPHSSLDDATPDQAYFNQPPFRLAA